MNQIDTSIRYNDNLTPQQVFDLCVYHLGTMKERAVGRGGECRYRTPSGNTCAVGYFISDSEYTEEMEGAPVHSSRMDKLFPTRLTEHENLLSDLQGLHDFEEHWDNNRSIMRSKLYEIADHLGLDATIISHPELAWNI